MKKAAFLIIAIVLALKITTINLMLHRTSFKKGCKLPVFKLPGSENGIFYRTHRDLITGISCRDRVRIKSIKLFEPHNYPAFFIS